MIPILYIAAIGVGELLGLIFGATTSALAHALLLLLLLGHYAWGRGLGHLRILPVLALLPLLRLLSLAMPVRQWSPIYWYALVGAPLLLAVGLAARLLELRPADLGLRRSTAWPQALIAASAVPLSAVGYLVLRPQPLIGAFSLPAAAVGALILLVFAGFTEELLFRGLLQRVAGELFGRDGLLFASVAFVALYTGVSSPGYLVFIGLAGLFFGWCVERTGAIWGVAVAHGLMLVGVALVWPYTGLGTYTL